MVAATTAGDDPASFAPAASTTRCVRIMHDPDRARHRFAYVRNVVLDGRTNGRSRLIAR